MLQVSRASSLKIPKQLDIIENKINSVTDNVAIKEAIATSDDLKIETKKLEEEAKDLDKELEQINKIPTNANDLMVITVVKKLGAYIIAITEKSPSKFRGVFVNRMQNLSLETLEILLNANFIRIDSEDKKKQLEELKQAIAKQASTAGTSTNRDIRTIEDIGTAKPLIDWRYVLREAIKYDVDWSYKNASIEDGIVVANLEEQLMPETEIVLDTSGSINEVLLKNFLRECKNILQHSRLKVGCFDTEFYGFHEIRTEEDIENMTFEGGGGTDFDVAVGAFSRRVENKIIFTDGEASMPDMPIDAIWIVFGGEKINPKGGKVIYIDQEQLEKLNAFYSSSKHR